MNPSPRRIIIGISGASGAIYGRRLIDLLDKAKCSCHVIVTDIARQILVNELGVTDLTAQGFLERSTHDLNFHDNADMFNPLASGSFGVDAMVICPCSSHTLAAAAAGLADTLLLRSAYVTLKQHRPLILVHREMPLTAIDLENMQILTRAGAIVCPAAPAFYLEPKTVSDLVDSVVGRVLDLLGIDHNLPIRWKM